MPLKARRWAIHDVASRLHDLDACSDAIYYVKNCKTARRAWESCPNAGWAAFLITRVLSRSTAVLLFAKFLKRELKAIEIEDKDVLSVIDTVVKIMKSKSKAQEARLADVYQRFFNMAQDGSKKRLAYVIMSFLDMTLHGSEPYDRAVSASEMVDHLAEMLAIDPTVRNTRFVGFDKRVRKLMSWEVLSHKLVPHTRRHS